MHTVKKLINGSGPIIIRIVIWAIGVTAVAVTAWGVMGQRVQSNFEAGGRRDDMLKQHGDRLTAVEEAVVEQRTDTKWMKDSLKRIEEKLEK